MYSGSLPPGPKILHVGRLDPIKNHEALINTMRLLPARRTWSWLETVS